jgi:hypothetical protein
MLASVCEAGHRRGCPPIGVFFRAPDVRPSPELSTSRGRYPIFLLWPCLSAVSSVFISVIQNFYHTVTRLQPAERNWACLLDNRFLNDKFGLNAMNIC